MEGNSNEESKLSTRTENYIGDALRLFRLLALTVGSIYNMNLEFYHKNKSWAKISNRSELPKAMDRILIIKIAEMNSIPDLKQMRDEINEHIMKDCNYFWFRRLTQIQSRIETLKKEKNFLSKVLFSI